MVIIKADTPAGRKRALLHGGLVAVAIVAILGATPTSRASAADPPRSQPQNQDPAQWVDALFAQPFVDIDEWRDKPVRHRYVHGGFKGTDTLFSIYLPPKEQYQGRFFQQVGAFAGNENAAQLAQPRMTSAVTEVNTPIGFAMASGAYFLETNNGYKVALGQGRDPTIETVMGYRANAAAAEYSRVIAAQMYGKHRTYGYVFGGSGGSLKTICGVENTYGVWDGSVPYVTGTTMAMPNVFTAAAHAYRLLKDKWPTVVDALDPGGSGDMYASLNKEEREALLESNRFGIPPRQWFAYDRLGYGPLANLIDYLVEWDPQYFEDFWKVPGYLGANPPESLKRARVQHKTTIVRIIMSDEATKMGLPVPPATRGAGGRAIVPAAIQLATMPNTQADLKGASLILKEGVKLSVSSVSGNLISVTFSPQAFAALETMKAGDPIQLDNSIYLAAQTYHRHQIPGPEFKPWDQFRGPDGKPLYPQRPLLLGPRFYRGGSGCMPTGFITSKMIVVQTMIDEYAHPWSADWYRGVVTQALGSRVNDNFRIWYVDNAMHGSPPPGPENVRIVPYTNVLQQALRDLSAWVEKGITPPANTNYKVVDAQVELPATARARMGVQPVITLTANGSARAEVRVGQPVTFLGVIEAPPGTGKVVSAEWDFEGRGDYPLVGPIKSTDASGQRATATTTYSFSKPGTYFPALRGASQRQGDPRTPYARIENLGRVRVVVK